MCCVATEACKGDSFLCEDENGGVSGLISAVMVMKTVEADLMRRIAVSISCTIYRTQ
jgi:hypothetical protein